MQRFHIPLTVPIIGGLFRKFHIDTMLMPHSGSYRYTVQARCVLSTYPEWHMLCSKNSTTLSSFMFEDLLCRWGPLSEIVTDNGPTFVQALDILADRYGIRHIRISPYNSQVNCVVERRHYDVWEAIIKSSWGGVSLVLRRSLSILGRVHHNNLIHRFVPLLHGSRCRATLSF